MFMYAGAHTQWGKTWTSQKRYGWRHFKKGKFWHFSVGTEGLKVAQNEGVDEELRVCVVSLLRDLHMIGLDLSCE